MSLTVKPLTGWRRWGGYVGEWAQDEQALGQARMRKQKGRRMEREAVV